MDIHNRRIARSETKMIRHGGLDMQGQPNYWYELSYRIPGGWATVPSAVEVYDDSSTDKPANSDPD